MNIQNLQIYEFNEINSTNEFLAERSITPPALCTTLSQTAGKGQHGRTWENQEKSALFSLKLSYSLDTNLNGLSLITALAIVHTLSETYAMQDMCIKWPNDIYLNTQKLAGILIENKVVDNAYHIVIGIGINIIGEIGVASLGQNVPRQSLIMNIVQSFLAYNQRFVHKGLGYFLAEWEKYDYLRHYKKIIHYNGDTYHASGITPDGCLILSNEHMTHILSSSVHMRVE